MSKCGRARQSVALSTKSSMFRKIGQNLSDLFLKKFMFKNPSLQVVKTSKELFVKLSTSKEDFESIFKRFHLIQFRKITLCYFFAIHIYFEGRKKYLPQG